MVSGDHSFLAVKDPVTKHLRLPWFYGKSLLR